MPYEAMRNGKIERVAPTPVSMAGASTIELGTATLLPGVIGWKVA